VAADAPYNNDGFKSCSGFTHVVTVYRDFAPNIPYTLKNQVTGTFAEVSAFSTADAGNIQAWSATNGPNQKWYLNKVGANQYQVINVNSGKCMDVDHKSLSAEANVLQWTCKYTTNQLWQLNPRGLGWYEVRSVQTAATAAPMCLDIKSVSNANGANIQQYSCGAYGYAAQQWLVELAP